MLFETLPNKYMSIITDVRPSTIYCDTYSISTDLTFTIEERSKEKIQYIYSIISNLISPVSITYKSNNFIDICISTSILYGETLIDNSTHYCRYSFKFLYDSDILTFSTIISTPGLSDVVKITKEFEHGLELQFSIRESIT
jgi:hypothetical protein